MMTIEQYLRGKVGFTIPDDAIATILLDRNVANESLARELDDRTKDLCRADLYMYCASTPSVKGKTEEAHGSWKHSEGGWESSAFDKRNLRQMANDIYALYGENQNVTKNLIKAVLL